MPLLTGRSSLWLLVFMVGVGGIFRPARAESPANLLNKLSRKREKVRTVEYLTTTRIRREKRVTLLTARLWEKGRGNTKKFRRFVTTETPKRGNTPASKVDSLMLSDGTWLWAEMVMQGTKMVIKSRPEGASDLDEIRRLAQGGKAKVMGHKTIGGRPCVVLGILGGKRSTIEKATYWITEREGLVLKSNVIQSDGTTTEMVVTEVKVNQPIDDDKFVYMPPAHSSVIDVTSLGDAKKTGGPTSP